MLRGADTLTWSQSVSVGDREGEDGMAHSTQLGEYDISDLFRMPQGIEYGAAFPSHAHGHGHGQFTPSDLEHAMSALQSPLPSSPSTTVPGTTHANLDAASQYDLFSSSAASASFDSARFRAASSAASSLGPSPQLPRVGLAHDYLYPSPYHASFDMMSMGAHTSGSVSPLTPNEPSPPYAFASTDKQDFAANAYPPELIVASSRPSTAGSMQHDDFGINSALGASVVPSSLHQFHQRQFGLGGFDLQQHQHQQQQQQQPSVPSQNPYPQTGPPQFGYDGSRFMAQQADMALRLPVAGMGIDDLARMRLQSDATSDLVTFIRPYLQQYVETPNRVALGERTLIVMSSKVAQKSYGTEKRFLCPPPTAVMIGNNWWSETNRRGEEPRSMPPRVVVSISGEPAPHDSPVEWTTTSGKSVDHSESPPEGTTYIGRAVGKQLFISDVDERKKKVEALIKIVAPTSDDEPERIIGTFSSRPIKVISKPSKKRQSAKNLELCINHGSTISLFHRLRSQTVSTKYLCVSGSGASFKGSDGAPLPGVDSRQRGSTPSFVARTAHWDAFVIYIVDVNKPGGIDTPPPVPPQPEYPSPPPNAIAFTNNGSQIPIYYNQTVVLQCLISGVVSPVLIIRKVDHATVVVGGGLQEGAKGVPDHYCAPGEVCGDPVSQLHKVAFEVYDATKPGPPAAGTPGISGAFLSCMGEKVNTYRPAEGRQWNSPNGSPGSHPPSLPDSPTLSPGGSIASGADYFSHFGGHSIPPSPTALEYPPSSDGGRVRRGKRGSLSSPVIKAASKARRRVNSVGSAGTRYGYGVDQNLSSGALWAVDIGETAVWTIVGTEQIRYNFYIPPTLHESSSRGSSSIPAKPITPFPAAVKYLPPDRASEMPKHHVRTASGLVGAGNKTPHNLASQMVTIYGENFSKSDPVAVFFGSEPSPLVEIRCTEVLSALPPDAKFEPGVKVPIILVRSDGVVFPSNVMYQSPR